MDGSTVHFPARAPQKIRAGCLLLTRESRGGFLALGRDGRGKLDPPPEINVVSAPVFDKKFGTQFFFLFFLLFFSHF